MARTAILTDSTSDLGPDVLAQHGVTMVPLHVQIEDRTYLDQVELSTDEFVTLLTTTGALPSTSQPTPAQFEAAFRDLAADYDHVVAILLSSKLSATTQSATMAAAAVADEIPVEIVDSRTGSMALGLQVLRAADLAKTGMAGPELAAQLRAEIENYQIVFFVDSLDYIQRGGRIGRASALIGGILQLKPLLRVDEGQIVPYERTRTRKKALAGLVEFAASLPHIERLAAIHVSDPEEAADLADQLAEATAIPRDEIFISQIGPVLSTHIGPGAMGIALDEGSQARRG